MPLFLKNILKGVGRWCRPPMHAGRDFEKSSKSLYQVFLAPSEGFKTFQINRDII